MFRNSATYEAIDSPRFRNRVLNLNVWTMAEGFRFRDFEPALQSPWKSCRMPDPAWLSSELICTFCFHTHSIILLAVCRRYRLHLLQNKTQIARYIDSTLPVGRIPLISYD